MPKRTTALYAGNPPKKTQGFKVGSLPGGWLVYERFNINPELFTNIKVISSRMRANKANFWLGYLRNEKRLARTLDADILFETQPALYDHLCAFLEKQYPPTGPANPRLS